jgi:hypothetical protein
MKRFAFAAVLIAMLSGCAVYVPPPAPRVAYIPQTYSFYGGHYWR